MENKLSCNICDKLIIENNLTDHVSSKEHIDKKDILMKKLVSKNDKDYQQSVIYKWQN